MCCLVRKYGKLPESAGGGAEVNSDLYCSSPTDQSCSSALADHKITLRCKLQLVIMWFQTVAIFPKSQGDTFSQYSMYMQVRIA